MMKPFLKLFAVTMVTVSSAVAIAGPHAYTTNTAINQALTARTDAYGQSHADYDAASAQLAQASTASRAAVTSKKTHKIDNAAAGGYLSAPVTRPDLTSLTPSTAGTVTNPTTPMATQSVTIMTTPGPNPSAVQAAIAAVVAGNTQATASVNPASVDATLAKEATDSLNVAVSDLKPTADVDVTFNGVTQTVMAGELAAVAPQLQVATPVVSVFTASARKADRTGSGASHAERGTGNGSNNAANSHSAHGLGGGNHIGGGSAQSGSRNVGHW